jgi:Protein of unknown function (DUF3567)
VGAAAAQLTPATNTYNPPASFCTHFAPFSSVDLEAELDMGKPLLPARQRRDVVARLLPIDICPLDCHLQDRKVVYRFMQTIFNSDSYCVVVFPDAPDGVAFEIMDKTMKREIFIGGALAKAFESKVQDFMKTDPEIEEVDTFLSQFDGMMQHRVVLH